MTTELPKILVVDDEPVSLMLLETILRRGNFVVSTAGSGQEALNLVNEKDFDLLILDLLMPDMDGLTLLELIREDPKQKNIPVIVFTAVSQNRVRQEAFNKGATTFLTKPVSSAELIYVVRKYLQPQAISVNNS